MQLSFFKYFFSYIFHSKTRQKLLFLAMVGLLLSSFSLIVLQSIMGGLQKGLRSRSKEVHGNYVIHLNSESRQVVENYLSERKIPYYPEYELELMARNKNYLTPIILHGVDEDKLPPFLEEKDLSGAVLGADIGVKLQVDFMQEVFFISPSHTDSFMGDIPRQLIVNVSDFYLSELSEVDLFHSWVRLPLVQNLIRERTINKIRLYQEFNASAFNDYLADNNLADAVSLRSWEDVNKELVWALKLETNVMLILFMSMTLLVAIAITAGFLIFFDKIKRDLLSFWILGSPRAHLMKLAAFFCHMMSFSTCLIGVLLGVFFLISLDAWGPDIMPDIFVERTIPVDITIKGLLLSLLIPYSISAVFSLFSLSFFKKENASFLQLIRTHG